MYQKKTKSWGRLLMALALAAVMACGLFAALPLAKTETANAAVITAGDTSALNAALNTTAVDGDTVRLTANITYSGQLNYTGGKDVTIDLNGFTLTAASVSVTNGGALRLANPNNGAFNMSYTGGANTTGAYADGAGSYLEITSVSYNGLGNAVEAAAGGEVAVFGQVTHTGTTGNGVYATGGGKVTVGGGVTALASTSGYGVYSNDGSALKGTKITVTGDIVSKGTGAYAFYGEIIVNGNITSADRYAVNASNYGAKVTVTGDVRSEAPGSGYSAVIASSGPIIKITGNVTSVNRYGVSADGGATVTVDGDVTSENYYAVYLNHGQYSATKIYITGNISSGTGFEEIDVYYSTGGGAHTYFTIGVDKPTDTAEYGGYNWDVYGDGKGESYSFVYVRQPLPEAAIGAAKYATLNDAIAAVQNGETIKLLKDITLKDNLIIYNGKTFTFDTDGFTLDFNLCSVCVYVGGTAVTFEGCGTWENLAKLDIYAGGKAVVNGDVTAMSGVSAESGASVTVNGGITVTNSKGVNADGAGTEVTVTGNINSYNDGIYAANGAKVTVTGDIYSLHGTGVYAYAASVTVNGNAAAQDGMGVWAVNNGGKVIINGNVYSYSKRSGYSVGIYADSNAAVTVTGDVYSLYGYGINACYGSAVTVYGNVVSDGTYAVYARYNAKVYITGTLTSPEGCSDIHIYCSDGDLNTFFAVGVDASTATGYEYNGYYWDVYTDNTHTNQAYVYLRQGAVSAAAAVISDVTVTGFVGVPMPSSPYYIITITVTDATITVPASWDTWFAGVPAGLTLHLGSYNATSFTVRVEGTPTAVSSALISVTIPAGSNSSGAAITSAVNANAKFDIQKAPAADAPYIVSSSPYDGEEDVSVGLNKISVTFDKAMNTSKGEAWLTDGNLYDYDVTASAVWSNGNKTVTFTVPATLSYSRCYYLDLYDFESADGGVLDYDYIPFKTQPIPAGMFIVTFSADEGGTVSATVDGSPIQSGDLVEEGKTVVFTAVPDTANGYKVSSWFDGGYWAEGDETEWRIENLAGAHDVTVYFMLKSYNVNVSAVNPEGGSAGANFMVAAHGFEVTVTAWPEDGYRVKQWTVNGSVLISHETAFVIDSIDEDYTIAVEFELIPSYTEYTVNFSVAGGNGTLTAAIGGGTLAKGASVQENTAVTFTAAPNAGYRVKAWKLNGAVIPGNTSNTYTHSDLTANITVTVEFEVVPAETAPAQQPSIGTQPAAAAAVKGGSVTLSVTATSPDGGTLSYQWYSNTTDGNSGGTAIEGATGASYTPDTAKTGTTYYYCVVTNTKDGTTAVKTSDAAAVTVSKAKGCKGCNSAAGGAAFALAGFCVCWFFLRKKR